ncbi:MAG TPA: nuclear transport factor 2 family protein [Acidimicrobiales bacterium]
MAPPRRTCPGRLARWTPSCESCSSTPDPGPPCRRSPAEVSPAPLPHDDHETVAARYAAAVQSGDAEAIAELTEPSAAIWHNFDGQVVDRTASEQTLLWLHRTVQDLACEDTAILSTRTGFVWQAVMTGEAPGGPLRAATCMVATLSAAGRIDRIDEYVDSSQLACLRRPGAGGGTRTHKPCGTGT